MAARAVSSVDDLLAAVSRGERQPIYLIAGDPVLAEPAARRLAQALAEASDATLEIHRRPPKIASLLDDLCTYSLFSSAKTLLAVDTGLLADRRAAADLIDAAAEVLPPAAAGGELSPQERTAASRLLQALHLFDIDSGALTPEAALEQLPDWVLQGGLAFRARRSGRGRGKRQAEELRQGLGDLLQAARRAGLSGRGHEDDLAQLSSLMREGLPEGHSLVLAEGSVATDHPVVETLAGRGAFADLGRVSEERGGGWQGLDLLAGELARETGVAIAADALEELARRTLRQPGDRKTAEGHVDPASTGRFAAEYRKLANLAGGQEGGRKIERELVTETVEDRGQEDVWQLLDAVGAGRGDEALGRFQRLIAAAEDPAAARFTFFALFADFCRQLTAVAGLIRLAGVPPGERSYPRFKTRHAPRLGAELEGGLPNPVARLHPYRLHRVYLAASRSPAEAFAHIPAWLFQTELQLKGESGEPDVALAHLIARVAALAAGP